MRSAAMISANAIREPSVAQTQDIRFERHGTAGVITLDRPRALNAVSHDMVRQLAAQLRRCRDDPAVTRVIVTAAGGRAFSAGGDLRSLYELEQSGQHEAALGYFRDEYALNSLIQLYPKPYVALIDGIVMGGGVGVSIHGSHRIAGDRFLFAMPEVGLGFFPDIGATWFLPRLPGELGVYCALTGERLNAADGVTGGVATHRVSSDRLADLRDALCGATPVDAIVAAFADPAGAGPVTVRREAINRLFAGDRIEDILARLDGESGDDAQWARTTAATIRTKAPFGLKIALAQMRRGRDWSFEDCMRAEFRLASRLSRRVDFHEGVRAVIIDKDNKPRWNPGEIATVTEAEIDRCFAPIDNELVPS
jgi:enoyl-CoA hydratase